MILKTKDDIGPLVSQLDELLGRKLTENQRRAIEEEKATVLAGAKAEAEAAYLIDFHLKDSDNWAVIHDLRLEHNGRVAQIDHLLIWSGLDVYVVESKGFRTKIRITHDRWEVLRHSHWTGVPSPEAQNERHILVLKELISTSPWAPRFLGTVKQPIRYINVVAVPPECALRGDCPEVMVVSIDNLVKTIRRDRGGFLAPTLFSGVSSDKLWDFALNLVDCHRPMTFDFAAKFGLPAEPRKPDVPRQAGDRSAQCCTACGKGMTGAEVRFCQSHSGRFAGQMLCRGCQAFAPRPATGSAGKPMPPGPPRPVPAPGGGPRAFSGPRCADCEALVEAKVAAYCRFNRQRFDGKTVCRTCQAHYAA